MLYHIWAWQPPCSCDQHNVNEFSFTLTSKLTYKIWLKMDQWYLRKASFNFHMEITLGQGKEMTLTLCREQNFVPPTHGGSKHNLALIGLAVTEKIFEIVDEM